MFFKYYSYMLRTLPFIVVGFLASVSYAKTDRLENAIGKAVFDRFWVSSPSSTQATDGLGPLYNARSCAECHVRTGRGTITIKNFDENDKPLAMHPSSLVRIGLLNGKTHPIYGNQLQPFATVGIRGEVSIKIRWHKKIEKYPDGTKITLRYPEVIFDNWQYGDPKNFGYSIRVTPSVRGLGYIDSLPEQEVIKLSDPKDKNKDGISGRVAWRRDVVTGKKMIGKFGWKSEMTTIYGQSAGAFYNDVGISTIHLSKGYGDCTMIQSGCRNAPDGNSPQHEGVEVGDKLLKPLVFYLKNQRLRTVKITKQNLEAYNLFNEVGCAKCHTPRFVNNDKTITVLYSDLLVHDMGDALASNLPVKSGLGGDVSGREWRTSPLWGIKRSTENKLKSVYLHDGRAENIEQAILWHGGEAKNVIEKFKILPKNLRKKLISFVENL